MQMSKVERSHGTNNLVIVAGGGTWGGEGGGGRGVEREGSISLKKKKAFIGLTYLLKFLKFCPYFLESTE